LAVFLLRIPIYGLLLWYLLTPEVRFAFCRQRDVESYSLNCPMPVPFAYTSKLRYRLLYGKSLT
jgi:hypothetical protein